MALNKNEFFVVVFEASIELPPGPDVRAIHRVPDGFMAGAVRAPSISGWTLGHGHDHHGNFVYDLI